MSRIEETILRNLLYNEDYARKIMPFVQGEYFQDYTERVIFQTINEHTEKYNVAPTKEILEIGLNESSELSEDKFEDVIKYIDNLEQQKDQDTNVDWLLDETERFCQEQAVYNALMESIGILEDTSETRGQGEIPEILTDALAVSFDPHVGHDYIEDYEKRFEFYHVKEQKIEFDLENMNRITKGGLSKKSLSIALAGTGVGKSLFMCHVASACLSQGNNVLYITLEMSEEKIAERIDANLLDVKLEDLRSLSKGMYDSKILNFKKKTAGTLIIKEYPTAQAHTGHFRHLINELNLKKEFKPDILFVDYLNICTSSRIKSSMYTNTYTYIKSIAEELRGLAVEKNIPIVSATQTTRTGFGNTDPDLTDTSESFGLPATADFMFALVQTEDMDKLNQICVKQLKNRYNDPTYLRRFILGIDRSKMRLYDIDDSEQLTGYTESDDSDEDVFDEFGDSKKTGLSFEGFKI